MKPLPLIDLHQDISWYYIKGRDEMFPVEYFDIDLKGRHGDVPKFKKGNVKLVFGSMLPLISTVNPVMTRQMEKGYQIKSHGQAPSTTGSSSIIFEHFKVYYQLAATYPKDIYLVREQKDVEGVLSDRRTGILLALEAPDSLQETTDLSVMYNLGLRSSLFSYNFDCRYAASCMSRKDYGLTGEGEELLGMMNKYGIIPDLSHASHKTCLDVLNNSGLPVIISHAMPKTVFNSARNIDDKVLEKLYENGGVIGAIFGNPLIGGKKDIKEITKHIFYVHDKFGPDMLAIGTDYFGLGRVGTPKGLEDITCVSNLWRALEDEGLPRKDTEKIAYGNALRVLKANARRWRRYA